MADEKKVYPPAYIKPGDIKKLTAADAEMEFHGVYDERVIDFLLAYYEWAKLREMPLRPSNDTLKYAERKCAKAFNDLPPHALKLVMQRQEQGAIWIPDPDDLLDRGSEDDNVG
jgi:hypothetical protein